MYCTYIPFNMVEKRNWVSGTGHLVLPWTWWFAFLPVRWVVQWEVAENRRKDFVSLTILEHSINAAPSFCIYRFPSTVMRMKERPKWKKKYRYRWSSFYYCQYHQYRFDQRNVDSKHQSWEEELITFWLIPPVFRCSKKLPNFAIDLS